MTKKQDIKQFQQACREIGLSASERYKASEVLHDEKKASGVHEHMTYGELLAWLREWVEIWRAP
jgi:hypothetical protein